MNIDNSTIVEAIQELAEELGRVPTRREWQHWDDSPCGRTTVVNQFGSWDEALDDANFPRNIPGSSESIRAVLYQNAMGEL